MLPSKALPAGAALVLAGNKATSGGGASALAAKRAPGAVCRVVLAMDSTCGLRFVVAAAGPGRYDIPDEDFNRKVFSPKNIKKMAEATSTFLQGVPVPKDSTFAEQVAFSKELEGFKNVCDEIIDRVGGAGLDGDVAASTLIGVHACAARLLLASRGGQQKNDDWKEPLEGFLCSSMNQTQTAVSDYMAAQNPKPKANSKDLIVKLAHETSALLRDVHDPKGLAFPEKLSFGSEIGSLLKVCQEIAYQVEKGGCGEDVAVRMLLGLQARILLLLSHGELPAPGSHDSTEALLLSSMHNTKISIAQYMTAQEAAAAARDDDVKKAAEGQDGDAKKDSDQGEDGDMAIKPKLFSPENIKKMAEATSSILEGVPVPKDMTFAEQVSFSKGLESLQNVCDKMVYCVGGAGLDGDVAIITLIGVQTRAHILLASRGRQQKADDWKEPVENFLYSSMYPTQMTVSDYMAAQNPKPKANSADLIVKLAHETSALLRNVCDAKGFAISEKLSFAIEVGRLMKVSHEIAYQVDKGDYGEDVAVGMLLGLQARIRLLLSHGELPAPGSHDSTEALLLSSMQNTKISIAQYMTAQEAAAAVREGDAKKTAEGEDGDAKKAAEGEDADAEKAAEGEDGNMDIKPEVFLEMFRIFASLVPHGQTMCSEAQVIEVLQKTSTMLDSFDPTHSSEASQGMFYTLRADCQSLMSEVGKHGMKDKQMVASELKLIHTAVLFVLGLRADEFSYADAPDDPLLASFRRLEIGLDDYEAGR